MYDCLLLVLHFFFFLILPPPPRSTLFPYTTLFRSLLAVGHRRAATLGAADVCVLRDAEPAPQDVVARSEEHTSELQSHSDLVCRLLLEKKKNKQKKNNYRNKNNQSHSHQSTSAQQS